MITRQLKERQFESLRDALMMTGHAEPLGTRYTVGMKINGAEYKVMLQPERHNKIVVLQALRVFRGERGPSFELITRGNLLSSFLEILIYQGVG